MVKKNLFAVLIIVFTVVMISSTPAEVPQLGLNLFESKPNVVDSGGGKATSPNHMTVASISQPAIGKASSPRHSNEAGFFTSQEEPSAVTGIAVTNTNDSGEGSLRWAIDQANINAGPDTIIFNIPDTDPGYHAGTGTWTITPLDRLPQLTDDRTIIDGSTQADFIGAQTNPLGPEIEIDGTNTFELKITSNNNVIRGIILNRFKNAGIYFVQADSNQVAGCYLGTDAAGNSSMGNLYEGIELGGRSSYNIIGGTEPGDGNLISGNGWSGVFIGPSCSFNRISYNLIGTDRTGINPMGNDKSGIIIGNRTVGDTAKGNIIGPGNIIAYNHDNGVMVQGPLVENNTITRNAITGNSHDGIFLYNGANAGLEAPAITGFSGGEVTGTACPNCIVEIFSDPLDEGAIYEGTTTADGSGNFSLSASITGPKLTATATDIEGNTSAFSEPFSFSTHIIVTNTNDSGFGSFYIAITGANFNAGPDTIVFNIPISDPGYDSGTGVWTIPVVSAIPWISDDATVIDGTTQSAFIGEDTNPFGPEIVLDGTNTDNTAGLIVKSANNVIKGLVIYGFDRYGLWFSSADSNRVEGNYIGIDPTGAVAVANGSHGIAMDSSSHNVIGGLDENAANVISGNSKLGIHLYSNSSWNSIMHNSIGTDRHGSVTVGNGFGGVSIASRSHNNIVGPGNVIAGNKIHGISIDGASSIRNTITQNHISLNIEEGIHNSDGGNTELATPTITVVTGTEVFGTACLDCIVEIFSDPEDEGGMYEGTTVADGSGNFTLSVGITGPYVTATATDSDGNTSEFSTPYAYSECERGDVDCNGNITPGDALCTFWRSILGVFDAECLCDCSEQASEANCDGMITPGDALCIFWRSIRGVWPDDCTCPTAKAVVSGPAVDKVIAQSVQAIPGETVTMTISVENPDKLDAFSMTLSYPSDLLEYRNMNATPATEKWYAMEEIMTEEGSVTIGGFNTEGISSNESVTLLQLSFIVRENATGHGEFHLSDLTDDLAGAQASKGSIVVRAIPTQYGLSQNYPNPFNPTTTISYTLPQGTGNTVCGIRATQHPTVLKIYNILGQELRTLVDEKQEAGFYTVIWDGLDTNGNDVPSGVYFYRLTAGRISRDNRGDFTETRRMVLLK